MPHRLPLHLVANPDAACAADARAHIDTQIRMRRIAERVGCRSSGSSNFVSCEQVVKLPNRVRVDCSLWVSGGEQAQHRAPRFLHIRCVCRDRHSIAEHRRTRCLESLCSIDLDDAHAACAVRCEAFVVAECGDVDSTRPRGLQNGRAFGEAPALIIDGYFQHDSSSFP